MVFTEEGKLTSLWLDGDYFERVTEIANKLHFRILKDKKLFHELTCADRLFFSGLSVNDEIVDCLLANDGFKSTTKLDIHRTGLTSVSLNKFVQCESIKHLSIVSDIIGLDELKAFKSQRPDCFVEIDENSVRSEITV